MNRPCLLMFFALLAAAIAGAQSAGPEQKHPPAAPCSGPEYRQLDFWVGEWKVQNDKDTYVGDSRIQPILKGCVILEEWEGRTGWPGKSYNAYDRVKKQWQQYWVSSWGQVTEFSGQPGDDSMTYTAETVDREGKPARRRMTLTRLDADHVRQSSEMSYDGGETWKTDYDFTYSRKSAATTGGSAEPPAARPEDVDSIPSIIAALYDAISGPAGQPRDWQRFLSLFAPGAHLVPMVPLSSGRPYLSLTPEQYIPRSEPILLQGFFEKEVARHVDRFGRVAQVFSTYEGRHKQDDAEPFLRGINSIQLIHDGQRWWVANITWQPETPELSLPPQYQKSSDQSSEEGYLTTPENVRLFYRKMGNGPQTVILPADLFLHPDFDVLAGPGRTLIYYDMRNRGRSQHIEDASKLTIQADVRDLEAVRAHFGAEKFTPVGYSYLGLMVVMYAMEHPAHVASIVQLDAVPRKFGTKYPEQYVNNDADQVIPKELREELDRLEKEGYHQSHPREFCEKYYDYLRLLIVGNPANAAKIQSPCQFENEWPVNFWKHLEAHFVNSVQKLDIPVEEVKKITVPVLTIHGTKDRNAPYGSGREWALTLSNARLITVKGAAHQVWVDEPKVLDWIDTFLGGEWPQPAEKLEKM